MKDFISVCVQENGDIKENLINKNHISRVIPTNIGTVKIYLINQETPLICDYSLWKCLEKITINR